MNGVISVPPQMKYLGRRFTSVYILAIYSPTIPVTNICMPPSVHRFFTTHSEHWIELTYLTNVNFRNLADSRADPIISRALCMESNSTVMEIEQQGVEHLIDRSPLDMTSGREYLHKRIPVQRAYRQRIHHHPLVIPLLLESVPEGRQEGTYCQQADDAESHRMLATRNYIHSNCSVHYIYPIIISLFIHLLYFATEIHLKKTIMESIEVK